MRQGMEVVANSGDGIDQTLNARMRLRHRATDQVRHFLQFNSHENDSLAEIIMELPSLTCHGVPEHATCVFIPVPQAHRRSLFSEPQPFLSLEEWIIWQDAPSRFRRTPTRPVALASPVERDFSRRPAMHYSCGRAVSLSSQTRVIAAMLLRLQFEDADGCTPDAYETGRGTALSAEALSRIRALVDRLTIQSDGG